MKVYRFEGTAEELAVLFATEEDEQAEEVREALDSFRDEQFFVVHFTSPPGHGLFLEEEIVRALKETYHGMDWDAVEVDVLKTFDSNEEPDWYGLLPDDVDVYYGEDPLGGAW